MSCRGESLAKRCRPKFSDKEWRRNVLGLQNESNAFVPPPVQRQRQAASFCFCRHMGEFYVVNLAIDTSQHFLPVIIIIIYKCIYFTLMHMTLRGNSIGYDLGSQGNPVWSPEELFSCEISHKGKDLRNISQWKIAKLMHGLCVCMCVCVHSFYALTVTTKLQWDVIVLCSPL